jgi:hypothetical protein
MAAAQINVTENQAIVIVDNSGEASIVELVAQAQAGIAEVIVDGIQGPTGATGPQGPAGEPGFPINEVNRIDKSIVYYDAQSESYRADATWTIDTIVDGANF